MAWTQADLDNLNKAIATGATRVKFQGHETEFRSLDEMFRLRDKMDAEVNGSSPAGVIFAEFHDGK